MVVGRQLALSHQTYFSLTVFIPLAQLSLGTEHSDRGGGAMQRVFDDFSARLQLLKIVSQIGNHSAECPPLA